MKKNLKYISAAIGLTIFAVLIAKMGVGTILEHLGKVGWWMLPAFIPSILWNMTNTYAWFQFLQPLSKKADIKELFKIKVIGEAVNVMTPVNFIAGDPARAYLLRHRYQMTECAASVVVDRTLFLISALIIILIGTALAFVELEFLPNNIKYGLPIVLAIAATFVGFIFVHQHKGLFSSLIEISRRFRIKKTFSSATLENFGEVDGHIQDFYEKNKKGFWIAILSFLLGRVLGAVEIFIIGWSLDHQFPFKIAFMLAAAAPIINFAFAFIPGSLGVLESTYTAILYFMNFHPAIGITIQIIRRLRAVIWLAVGFIFLGTHDRKRLLEAEARHEI